MRNRILIIFLLILPSLILADGSTDKVSKRGTTGASFLEIPVGAQAMGMGGAYVSVVSDASALYWNPAAIARSEMNEVVFSHINWIADTKHDFGGVVIPFGSLGTLGLSYTSLTMADMKVTTIEKPDGTGEYFSAGDLAIGLSYARSLSERFSVGFTAKYIQQSIWHMSASAFAIDFGTVFKTDLFGGMTIGASMLNFGTQLKLEGRDTRQFISLDASKLGSSSQIPTNIEMDGWDLPLTFQFGVSTYAVNTKEYKFLISADAIHPNNDYESVNIGSQFSFRDLIYIRGGWNSLFLTDAEGGISFGVGINTTMLFSSTPVCFDYAYKDCGRLKAVHYFSVDVRF
jgi:hypothetical protein